LNILQRVGTFFRNIATLPIQKELRTSVGLSNTEAWNAIFPEFTLANNVSIESAQKLSVVYTCLNVLGETVGSLPCEVRQYTPKGRVSAPTHPVYRLLHDRPNQDMTAFDFWAAIEKIRKAWGNAYAEIERGFDGNPKALWIRPSQYVVQSMTPEGYVFYEFSGRTIRATDMLHFKNYSTTGYTGLSVIRQNALSIGMGLQLKDYNSKIIDRPYGFLTTESRPKDLTAKQNVQAMWGKKDDNLKNVVSNSTAPDKVSVSSALQMPLLYGGVKFEQLSLPADDVAFIESTNLTNKDIYGIFRVPPTFGQDWEHTPYNGAEQQDLVFAKYTLASIRGYEQECTEKLFPEYNKTDQEGFYVKFNLKGLLSGDHTSRQAFYSALFNIGAMSANEIRECEDQTHYEGGDEYYIQGALVPVSLIGDLIEAKIKQLKNKAKPTEKVAAKVAKEVKAELRAKLKEKLNGHYKDIEEIVQ